MAYLIKRWSISTSPLLELITFIYFFIPYIIFFLGYLNWYVALAFIVVFAKVIQDESARIRNPGTYQDCTVEFSPPALLFIALVIVVWIYFSGIGHFAYTNYDYLKHEAVFHDLVQLEWPVYYTMPEDHSIGFYLDYYFAYYLVPSAAGKWLGYAATLRLSFVWALTGAFISIAWLFRLLKNAKITSFIAFILFSGLDVLAYTIYHGLPLQNGRIGEWEFWVQIWQFSGNTSLLYWVPQHAIPGWCLTAVLVDKIKHERNGANSLLWYSLSFLWSPFVTIGLSPFLFLHFAFSKKRNWISFSNIAGGGAILTTVGLLYISSALDHKSGFVWQLYEFETVWVKLLVFYFFEFAIFWIFSLYFFKRGTRKDKAILALASIIPIALPFYIFGLHNDLTMRASIPSLFIVQYFVIHHMSNIPYRRKRLVLAVFCAIWAIGALCSLREIGRHIVHETQPLKRRSVVQLSEDVGSQYMGMPESFFFKYIAKTSGTYGVLERKIYDYMQERHRKTWDPEFKLHEEKMRALEDPNRQ